ncbi:hypothetical protein SynPROSU1_01543 [Synechococcus sp. PROS-U-1]|nr:hypothetical protein SynPROSU1_01543 [Synechococcus sp. PROS-U-1]
MGTDLTALLLSSVFLGVGFIIAKYFPEVRYWLPCSWLGLRSSTSPCSSQPEITEAAGAAVPLMRFSGC